MINEELVYNATIEAIYFWNRDEYYYHQYFSKIDKIYKDKPLLDFFTDKIFEVFLKGYSIRRNLSSGFRSVDKFIDEIFETDFVDAVQNGKTDIIDKVSVEIKAKGASTNRQTISLLSKVAFLINPHKFSLFDSLTKNSIAKVFKDDRRFKRKELNSYSGFINQTNQLRLELANKGLFESSRSILEEFKDSEAYSFFSLNNDAFEMRIVDKYLWLLGQDPNGRKKQNEQYLKFLNFNNNEGT